MTTATLEPATASDMSVTPQPTLATGIAGDTEVEIVDVVGGARGYAVDDLVAMHRDLFPAYQFVATEIVDDAGAPSQRVSLIVHQWLLMVAGRPAGLLLFDTNVARGVAVIHFLGIERPYRSLRLDGERFATWMCHRVRENLGAELAEHAPHAVALGVFGESSDRLVRRWLGAGFRRVALPYAEPVAGRHWRVRDDRSMRQLNLLWLPMHPDDTSVVPGEAGAAAFLIDHYALPLEHPTVVAATGGQRFRRGARR